ncbi:DUF3794 domain-containing protein [Sporomusa aerivorans]|uniref:DUF3794 domain-containing protein n=1 Tax=Sporomusa aerivorans TaxID=204936 RepID=UPI00352B7B03
MGRTCTQIFIDGSLTIPGNKPDIKSILRVTATPAIQKTVSIRRHVIFIGCVRICMEYVACVPDGTHPIHFVSFVVPFRGLLCNRRARSSREACMKTQLLFQEFQVIDPRTIEKMIAIQLHIRKFSRVGKHMLACSSQPCHIIADKPDKLISSPVSHECSDEMHHHNCKADSQQHSDKDNQHQNSFSSKAYYPTGQDNLNQHSDFYLPMSVRPFTQ